MISTLNSPFSFSRRVGASKLARLGTLLLVGFAANPAWAQRSTPIQLVAPDATTLDRFGSSIAVDGDTMVVGRQGVSAFGRSSGGAYVYRWTGTGWSLESSLIPSDPQGDGLFGNSVSIFGDTIVVGANGTNSFRGAAYVFRRSGTVWQQEARLTASDGAAPDNFGTSVSLFADTIAVGALTPSGGSAYIFQRSGSNWGQIAKVAGLDTTMGDRFGTSVSLGDGTLVVGAPVAKNLPASATGAAYIFTRSGNVWSQQARVASPDTLTGADFGASVAIAQETIAVGAPGTDASTGAAYVFVRSAGTWSNQGKLVAPDRSDFDQFGTSVAMAGDSVVVGASFDTVGTRLAQGSACVFTRSGTTWTQQAQLFAPGGTESGEFGAAVAISGDTAVVGTPGDLIAGTLRGSAWTFSRVGSAWIGSDLRLLASDGIANDQLGSSVSVSGDFAIIGAPKDAVGANWNQGSAYLFVRSGDSWIQEARISAADGVALDGFANAVAISGTNAVIGARSANNGKGSAYLFSRVTSPSVAWVQRAKLVASDAASTGSFGSSVSISGTTAVVGSPTSTVGANQNQGAAYVFVQALNGTWPQRAKLTASGGSSFSYFGSSVSISGTNLLVGAPLFSSKGAVWAFTGSDAAWTERSVLSASDGASSDFFGASLAVSGDTALVGAPNKSIGANTSQGAAYIFTRAGSFWNQVAKLAPIDGAANAGFGASVALNTDTALVGAPYQANGTTNIPGCAYVFSRSGTTWSQVARHAPAEGAPGNQYGRSVALSGSAFVVGAPMTSIDSAAGRGAAYISTPAYNSASFAVEDSRWAKNNLNPDATYPSVAAALTPLASGQSLSASELAWRSIAAIDTGARAIGLTAAGDVRWPSEASVMLQSISSLTAGSALDVFGTIVLLGNNKVSSQSMLLGSRSTARIYGASTLSIATGVSLFGQMRVYSGADVQFNTPRVSIDAHASFTVFGNATVRLSGSFDAAIDSSSRFVANDATIRFAATGAEQTFEAMSTDLGPTLGGLNVSQPGRYPIKNLQVEFPSVVRIVDARDNDGLSGCEAIYVDTLQVDAGARLVNTGCSRIYYKTLINNGTIDVPANVIQLPPPCPADLNDDTVVDDADFVIFAAAYNILDCADPAMPSGCPADLNADLFVDDADFVFFANAYDELLCP
ncbi:MAG: hypothetical protein K2Y21_00235 [Phycisphaerales bacterium]|nr:hypothetical protein [Phycisphaerales bacterium]